MSASQVVFSIVLIWQVYIGNHLVVSKIYITIKKMTEQIILSLHLKRLFIFVGYCLVVFFFTGILSINIALSNDPRGNIFIAKPFGDINNCGPIVALMAIKYVNQTFKTNNLSSLINRARKIVEVSHTIDTSDDDSIVNIAAYDDKISQHWWKMSDIKTYLSHNDVHYQSIIIDTKEESNIIRALNDQAVVIINVNMNDIPFGANIGKPYFTFPIPGGWGHFLMIVGYQKIEGKLVFEVHDSYTKQGRNHYYYADTIMQAIQRYYHEVLAINKGMSLNLLWASAQW